MRLARGVIDVCGEALHFVLRLGVSASLHKSAAAQPAVLRGESCVVSLRTVSCGWVYQQAGTRGQLPALALSGWGHGDAAPAERCTLGLA